MINNGTLTDSIEAGTLPQAVQELVQQFNNLWWESKTDDPPLGRTYTAQEQSAREAYLKRFVDAAISEMKHPPRTPSERDATQVRILSAFGAFAKSALGWEQRHLDVLLSHRFDQVAIEFAQMARYFDPAVSAGDIFQASRNAWVMNGLQVLLGLPVQLTPAIFAYSMLYPYSDNYLDDAAIPEETKLAFNERFRQRLEGKNITPANAREQAIFDLVAMIEGQYDRSRYPQLFESLLAIHRAQVKSIRLLRRHASPYEVNVLDISLEKGGTSVLADGYLVAGSLTRRQATFMFGFGALLQLGDDLEDILQDSHDGLLTVFSQTARHWPLDAVTTRTLHFGEQVLQYLDCFDAPGSEPLKDLIQKSTAQAFISSAGGARRLYTRPYLREFEAHSPFRFSALDRQRHKVFRHRVRLMRLIEAFATSDYDPVQPGIVGRNYVPHCA
jgi:hypothetical protein